MFPVFPLQLRLASPPFMLHYIFAPLSASLHYFQLPAILQIRSSQRYALIISLESSKLFPSHAETPVPSDRTLQRSSVYHAVYED